MIKIYAQQGICWIGLKRSKQEIIGIGGIYPFWSGVCQCWIFLNQEAKNYPKTIFKAFQENIDNGLAKYNFHRLQTYILDKAETINLIEHLGFKREGIMKKFAPTGEDMILYAKLYR